MGGGREDWSEGGGLWSHGEWVEKKTQGRGESPYSPTFRCATILPPEMEISTLLTFVADSCKNDELLSRDLDLAEEFRNRALARLKNYQMKVKRSYDKKGSVGWGIGLGVEGGGHGGMRGEEKPGGEGGGLGSGDENAKGGGGGKGLWGWGIGLGVKDGGHGGMGGAREEMEGPD
ncbi:unnamed protein product [Prunus armeniaca]